MKEVPGYGNKNSTIAIVSYAPGRAEEAAGIPFVAKSGELLYNELGKLGFRRNEIYTTNVFKIYLGERPYQEAEFEHWKNILIDELAALPNLKYLFILGTEALVALTGNKWHISNYRGSIIPIKIKDRELLAACAFNPAHVLRSIVLVQQGKRPIIENALTTFQMDCKKFKLMTAGKLSPYYINHLIKPSFAEAVNFIDSISPKLPLSYDIEVFGKSMVCIGLAQDKNEGMCINFLSEHGKLMYSQNQEIILRRKLAKVLSSHPNLVAQNAMFDNTWLAFMERFPLLRTKFDTLLAHHTLHSTLPHGLDYLVSAYTTHPYYKDDKFKLTENTYDEFWKYNVKDACLTLAVQQGLANDLARENLANFFFDHVMRAQYELCKMTLYGAPVDVALKEALASTLGNTVNEIETKLRNLLAENNLNNEILLKSPVQIIETLQALGVKTKTTNVDALDKILSNRLISPTAKKFIELLLEYRKETKFLSTYVSAKIDPDNRVRCSYKQFGTQSAPGRLSSAKTPWNSGLNLQNIPSRAYGMFHAEPGYALGYFDLEQAEARVVGWEANIAKWKEQFERARLDKDGFDCHRALASEMWGIPYDEVPKTDLLPDGTKSLRFIAKRCRHGLNYRMQPARLSETTGLSFEAAAEAYNLYHKTTPELRRWWADLEREVKRNRCLVNAYGRRRMFLDPQSDMDALVAFKPQSTIGDKVTRVIYMAQNDSSWPSKAQVLMNIHDAVICTAPLDQIDKALEILVHYAEEPLTINGDQLIIPASAKRTRKGTKWRIVNNEIEFYEDPDGLHRWVSLEK